MSEKITSEVKTGFWEVQRNRRGAITLGLGGLAFAIGGGMSKSQDEKSPDCESLHSKEVREDNNDYLGFDGDGPANKTTFGEDEVPMCPVASPAIEQTPTPDPLVQR